MTISDLLIISAATWWTSYVLTNSDGPFQVFAWLREHIPHGRTERLAIQGDHNIKNGQPIPKDMLDRTYMQKIPGLLDCPVCLSIWVAVVFVLAPVGWLTYTFAAAGIAMWIHSYSGWKSYG